MKSYLETFLAMLINMLFSTEKDNARAHTFRNI